MLKNFKCKRCGSCCNPPRLYKPDIERIKKLGYKEQDFIYTDNFNNNYLKDKTGKCMFLKKGKTTSCIIYENRPKICRLYPSELVNGSCKPVELAFDRLSSHQSKTGGMTNLEKLSFRQGKTNLEEKRSFSTKCEGTESPSILTNT